MSDSGKEGVGSNCHPSGGIVVGDGHHGARRTMWYENRVL